MVPASVLSHLRARAAAEPSHTTLAPEHARPRLPPPSPGPWGSNALDHVLAVWAANLRLAGVIRSMHQGAVDDVIIDVAFDIARQRVDNWTAPRVYH